MVAECLAKCVKIRLREKTPTLRCGKYAGYSVRDVFQDQRYWQSYVVRNPILCFGSLSRFVEIDARLQQRLKQRLQERKDRMIMQSMAASIAESKKRAEKPPDYTYSGEEVIGAGVLRGMSFKDALSKSKRETLSVIMVQYRAGRLRDPSLRDLARYIQQEYRQCRYHGIVFL